MSRILEALRRAEQDRNRAAGVGGNAPVLPLPEMLRSTVTTTAAPRFAKLEYRPQPDHPRVAAATDSRANGAEHFRLLRYRLEAMRRQHPLTSLLISSAIPGEGKTLVATNLAETLAQGSSRVLLVDADLRRPGVHRSLGLPEMPGLAEVLQDQADWRSLCREVTPLRFFYLPAGTPPRQPATLLQSPRLKNLLAEAGEVFDWILIDSPPLVPFADSLYLAEASQGVLLVTRERVTPIADFQRALDSLKDMPLIGIVFNAIRDHRRDDYYYAYYYGDKARGQGREMTPAEESAERVDE